MAGIDISRRGAESAKEEPKHLLLLCSNLPVTGNNDRGFYARLESLGKEFFTTEGTEKGRKMNKNPTQRRR